MRDYVASREPVGSKSIVDRHAFGVSAATIRNDMAQLEDEQLIVAPHTSSGRVPTDKGYRVFVDHLAAARPLSSAQRHAIETFLGASGDLDDVLGRTVRLLSQLTNQVALVQYPSMVRARVQHVELVRLGDTRLMVVLITDTARVEQRVVESDVGLDESALTELRTVVNGATVGCSCRTCPGRSGRCRNSSAPTSSPSPGSSSRPSSSRWRRTARTACSWPARRTSRRASPTSPADSSPCSRRSRNKSPCSDCSGRCRWTTSPWPRASGSRTPSTASTPRASSRAGTSPAARWHGSECSADADGLRQQHGRRPGRRTVPVQAPGRTLTGPHRDRRDPRARPAPGLQTDRTETL